MAPIYFRIKGNQEGREEISQIDGIRCLTQYVI